MAGIVLCKKRGRSWIPLPSEKSRRFWKGSIPKKSRQKHCFLHPVSLPSITSFQVNAVEDEDSSIDFSVDTSSLLQGLDPGFMSEELTKRTIGEIWFQVDRRFKGAAVGGAG